MSVIIFLIILLTIAQVVVCNFTLYWLIALVCRFIFCLRMIGAQFKVRSLCIGEAVAFALMVLVNMLFNKDNVPWLRIFEYLLFSLGCCGLEFLDTLLYVYTVEDDEEDTNENYG